MYLDLENPRDRARLEDPMLALENVRGLVILDEIQRMPGLFEVLRVLADRRPRKVRFLILGSASPDLVRGASETLAGRVAHYELGGFSLGEVGVKNQSRLWLRGGLPRSFLAAGEGQSCRWREEFIRTFLERDLPQLGVSIPSAVMGRFWKMFAHFHGQVWNSSEFAASFGVAHTTVRRYLDLLAGSYMARELAPFHENLRKRQVKSPKVFLRNSGVLHSLLDIERLSDLEAHPKVGASWEGFAMENIIERLGASARECFFWGTHGGAELDLLVVRGRKRLGFEFKRTSAPKASRSMHVAISDLRLDGIDVIYPGAETFPLSAKIRAVGLSRLLDDVRLLPGGRR